jgi:hypothetical protein
MKTKVIWVAMALAALTIPAPASAQFGMLKRALPGGGESANVSAVDPDTFLAETLETTKYMMTAAAVLADAAGHSAGQADLALRVRSINEVNDVKELGALKAGFQQDLDALNSNKDCAAAIQSQYQKGSLEQRARIGSAAYNFALGAFRNVKLAQQAPQLTENIKSNPRLLMKANQLRLAAELVMLEAKGTVSMAGSIKTLMSASKIDVPAEAETTKPKPIEFS